MFVRLKKINLIGTKITKKGSPMSPLFKENKRMKKVLKLFQ